MMEPGGRHVTNISSYSELRGQIDQVAYSAPKAMNKAERDSLLNRLADPEEVSQFIAYLLTTKQITRQVFSLESRM